jgi:D-lyxose ketol-isomerase
MKRAGDIWYQLETAAREVFKSLEGVNVADYERRVNEVLLLAFQLRTRQREARARKPAKQLELIGDPMDSP